MGAGANSSKNKSLNDRRERAVGRRGDRGPEREAIREAGAVEPGQDGADGAAAAESRQLGSDVDSDDRGAASQGDRK